MTSAAKPKRRPPLTTLATRLMPTSFSVNSLSSRSRAGPSPSPRRRRSPGPRDACCVRAIGYTSSELQAALAGGIGQSLDPAVVEVGAAVKHDPLDAGRLGALGEELADRGGRRLVGTALQLGLEPLFEGRGRSQRV